MSKQKPSIYGRETFRNLLLYMNSMKFSIPHVGSDNASALLALKLNVKDESMNSTELSTLTSHLQKKTGMKTRAMTQKTEQRVDFPRTGDGHKLFFQTVVIEITDQCRCLQGIRLTGLLKSGLTFQQDGKSTILMKKNLHSPRLQINMIHKLWKLHIIFIIKISPH
jgi:hypothetical protein